MNFIIILSIIAIIIYAIRSILKIGSQTKDFEDPYE